MPKPLKYSREQIQHFLDYAKENKIGILKMLAHFKINRRTFYLSAHRYRMTTDGVRAMEAFNTRAMSKEQVDQILAISRAKRLSHKKACTELGLSYNTFRGAVVRFHIDTEKNSSTYSREDVQKTIDYAKANHISLAKACRHFGYKYHLLSPSAKRYGMKLVRDLVVFDEAKALPEKEFVDFYLRKGYAANEIYHVMARLGRKTSRGMIYYYCKEKSEDRIQQKIDKLNERLGKLRSSQVVKTKEMAKA